MLTEDYELTREDVQLLSSRDALTAFFARLGYDTNHRLVQNVAAMSITSDNLKSSITHIERLASQHGRMFEVYLFELKSVTIGITQNIVRTFRNRSGDFLLVLTDDYQRLDFVLVERYSPAFPKLQDTLTIVPAAPKQAGVRPRVLTVNRRQPDPVALRVLRRFSYTETDTLAQYDKLLSAYDVADWSEPFFNNRALFSDYYLTRRLPHDPAWKDPDEAAAMTRAFKQLRELYAGARETFSNQPEAVVRTKLLEPVLTILGFTFQPVKAGAGDTVQPDYKLYSATGQAYDKPLALCLAYTWGRNLDGKDEQRDSQAPDENPGAAVVTLLDSGEADWAIITNGKIWRLYAAKAHSRATNYYEIDLEETLALPAANLEDAFRYFWLLFRASAFVATERVVEGEQRQLCFLDSLLNESERYARELGERLKKRVFEEIFPHFARGFIIHARRNGQLPANLDSLSPAERHSLLEPFFSGTLTFLYRLLFLLYAESRDLLPVRELRGYHEKSLEKLKKEIADKAGTIEDEAPARIKAACNDLSTALYDRLQALFQAVDQGDTTLNVPVYNGGLFVTAPDPADPSPEAAVARFLATHKIPDRQLALGLDRMARDPDEKRLDLVPIDYKSLGVRQLGSIYERLLEFKLHIAPEEMALVKGKKTEEIVPYAEAQQKKLPMVKEGRGNDAHYKTLPKDAVYLENDRCERKATGSYYTPDYIVKYIIANTVGPVLHEKLEALRPAFREAEKTLRAERARYDALKKQGRVGDTPENQAYLKHRATVNEVFFDLKVLDPAMGSGHFLVEAVDYITDRIADFLTAFKWNPVIHELARTRHEIQEEMERRGVTIDMSKLTDINLLKRQVLKRCIYGVDLNPMAVELAKVSLWLDCFTLGAPLSFLDHHMKCGNSLIGGSVQEVQDALSQDLFGYQFAGLLHATELMRHVGELSDVTAQEVAESRKAYKGAYDALAPFKQLLDVWLSEYFGNKGAKHTTRVYAGVIVTNNYSKANPEDKKAIETALTLAQTRRFFHWELEFPEVFYDETKRRENGGFDAVVGNPPYDVLAEKERGEDLSFLTAYIQGQSVFAPAVGRKIDLFRLFIAKGIELARRQSRLGQIVPMSLLADQQATPLRKHLLKYHGFIEIEAFPQKDDPQNRVFFEAKLPTCIVTVMNKPDEERIFSVTTHPGKLLEEVSGQYVAFPVDIEAFDKESFVIPVVGSPVAFRLAKRLSAELRFVKFGELSQTFQGEINETTMAHLLSDDPKDGPKVLRGGNVQRYQFLEDAKQGSDKYLRLEQYRKEVRGERAIHSTRLRFGYQRNAALDNWRRLIFGPLPNPCHCFDSISYLPAEGTTIYYYLAVLNSSLQEWRFRLTSSNNHVSTDEIASLPIPRIHFTTPASERAYYLEKARKLYEYCLSKYDQICVTGFVEHHLSKEPEESDVVHDLLAFLAEEMIRLNKEKQAAQKEFLNWLVTTLKILPDRDDRKGIEVLTGKSKLVDYPGDYQKGESPLVFEELQDILLKNKARLGVSLSDSGLVDQIKARYEDSLGLVLPVKESLARTDTLIDQVVYRLYGLTEDEIGVVEGRES